MINTIEDLVTALKQLEVRAHAWEWNTDNAAEIDAIDEFYNSLHSHLEDFVILSIGRFGLKEEGIGFEDLSYQPYSQEYVDWILEKLEEFLINHLKNPQTDFTPELEAVIVKMIRDITKFNYAMTIS